MNTKGKPIVVKTLGQQEYVHAIRRRDMVFGIGPAGTGKTYLAVVMAVNALKDGSVKRIVLTRPAVEAGESLGFLPGDLKEKVDPYLRPLYDALHDVFGLEHTNRLLERGTIEVAHSLICGAEHWKTPLLYWMKLRIQRKNKLKCSLQDWDLVPKW